MSLVSNLKQATNVPSVQFVARTAVIAVALDGDSDMELSLPSPSS